MADVQSLLSNDEPPAYRIEHAAGKSPFFLICDHASDRIPKKLLSLGVSDHQLRRHIAWDIGAAQVALKLGSILDAFTILQNYSRLVIDCNRPIGSPGSIVRVSERTPVPGNESLTQFEVDQRQHEIFWPYHNRIRAELDARRAQQRLTILISVHSFTPVFMGDARSMHAGILYNKDVRLAHPLLAQLREEPGLVVGDNQPYRVSDITDYAIPEYGEKGGRLHVELEIRQDLIADDHGQIEWAHRIARALVSVCDSERFTE